MKRGVTIHRAPELLCRKCIKPMAQGKPQYNVRATFDNLCGNTIGPMHRKCAREYRAWLIDEWKKDGWVPPEPRKTKAK